MTTSDPNKRTASTTWEWRRVKITPPAGRPKQNGASAASTLPPWPRRDGLSLLVKHRGGAESWWEIKARGRDWRFPGHWCLEDVMAVVFGERSR